MDKNLLLEGTIVWGVDDSCWSGWIELPSREKDPHATAQHPGTLLNWMHKWSRDRGVNVNVRVVVGKGRG